MPGPKIQDKGSLSVLFSGGAGTPLVHPTSDTSLTTQHAPSPVCWCLLSMMLSSNGGIPTHLGLKSQLFCAVAEAGPLSCFLPTCA
jgi:hypothetical protein